MRLLTWRSRLCRACALGGVAQQTYSHCLTDLPPLSLNTSYANAKVSSSSRGAGSHGPWGVMSDRTDPMNSHIRTMAQFKLRSGGWSLRKGSWGCLWGEAGPWTMMVGVLYGAWGQRAYTHEDYDGRGSSVCTMRALYKGL